MCLPSNSITEEDWQRYWDLSQFLDGQAPPDVLRGRLEYLRVNDDVLANLDAVVARTRLVDRKRQAKERKEAARVEEEIAAWRRLEEERREAERRELQRVEEERATKERRKKELVEMSLAEIRREVKERERREQEMREMQAQAESVEIVVEGPQEAVEEQVEEAPQPEKGATEDLRVDSAMGTYPVLQEEQEELKEFEEETVETREEQEVDHEAEEAEAALRAEQCRAQLLSGIPATSITGIPPKQVMLDYLSEKWPQLRDGLKSFSHKDLERTEDMRFLVEDFINPGEMCFLSLKSMATDEEIVGTGWDNTVLSSLARTLYSAQDKPFVSMREALQRIRQVIGDANERIIDARMEARQKAAASGKAAKRQPRTVRK